MWLLLLIQSPNFFCRSFSSSEAFIDLQLPVCRFFISWNPATKKKHIPISVLSDCAKICHFIPATQKNKNKKIIFVYNIITSSEVLTKRVNQKDSPIFSSFYFLSDFFGLTANIPFFLLMWQALLGQSEGPGPKFWFLVGQFRHFVPQKKLKNKQAIG